MALDYRYSRKVSNGKLSMAWYGRIYVVRITGKNPFSRPGLLILADMVSMPDCPAREGRGCAAGM